MGKPWGHQPWENDTAQDFTGKLDKKPLMTLIVDGLESDDYDKQRVVAWMLAQLIEVCPWGELVDRVNYRINKIAALAVWKLNHILDDKDWFGLWESATKPKLRRNMQATILVLKKFAD